MITDITVKVLMYLGTDGFGCGGIVRENIPVSATQCDHNFIDPYEQFSSQAEFMSEWLTFQHQHVNGMNKLTKTLRERMCMIY